MSIRVQALIWEHAPYHGNTLLAFLALGDWSDDKGHCWPKMETLARKSRQSERGAQYAIQALCRDGFLSVEVNPGKGRQNDFRINLQKLHLLEGERVQTTTTKGANGNRKRCKTQQRNKEEPLPEPSKTKTHPNPPFHGRKSVLTVRDRRKLNDLIDALMSQHLDGYGQQRYENGKPIPPTEFQDAVEMACARLLIDREAAWEVIRAAGLGDARKPVHARGCHQTPGEEGDC
jgi:hypothetical protein